MSVLFVFLLSQSISSFTCGQVTCEIDNNKVLTITGEGKFTADQAHLDFQKITIPSKVTIDANSFTNCQSLKEIIIENDQTLDQATIQGLVGKSLDSLTIAGTATFASQIKSPFESVSTKQIHITSPNVKNFEYELFKGILSTTYFELKGGDVPLNKDSFTGLTSVQTLIIGGETKLDTDAANVFVPMKDTLTTLELGGKIELVDPSLLSNLPQLTTLYFGPVSGKISGANLRDSTNLKKITFANGASIAEGDSQFYDFEYLETVLFFTSITIPAGAFKGSTVQTVSLENSGIVVSANAFADCEIDSVSILSSSKVLGTTASKSLKETVLTIDSTAFSNSKVHAVNVFYDPNGSPLSLPIAKVFGTDVSVVQLNNGIKTANSPAFDDLKEVNVALPPTFESVPPTLFKKCVSIKIGFTETNNNIEVSADNAIYNKGGTTLMAVLPQATNVEVKLGVTEINAEVFKDLKNLKEVSIPSSVTNIGDGAFTGCSSLTQFTYKGETEIKNNIFDENAKVTISVTDEYKGDSFGGKTIHDHSAKPDDPVTPDDPKKPNKAAIIAGSVVGVVVVIAIIVVVAYFLIKRKNSRVPIDN